MSERERVLALRQDLGRQLRGLRKEADLSQQQLASRIGYTRSAVSNTESGGYAARRFWRKCDELFGTDGVLARRYDQLHLQTATHRHPAGNTQRIPPDGNAGLRRLRATGGSGALGVRRVRSAGAERVLHRLPRRPTPGRVLDRSMAG